MPLDRFVQIFVIYELKNSQMFKELVISLSLIRILEGRCLLLSPFMIEFK